MLDLKNKKILLTIIILNILLCTTVIFFIFYNNQINQESRTTELDGNNQESRITALEGKVKADELAKKWNSSAILVNVQAMGKKYEDGKCDKWGYSYSSNNPNINLSEGFAVTIFANGTYATGETSNPPSPYPIMNWKINSDKALEIALSNPKINKWLSQYDDAYIESIILGSNQTYCAWGIGWISPGYMDNPHSAGIGIDANTGYVLNIRTQYN